MARYKQREPKKIVNRDPEVCEPSDTLPHMPRTIAIHVDLIKCKVCGHSTMRKGGGTHPDLTSGRMARRWTCAHCGQRYCVFSPPTEAEIAKHFKEE